MTKTNAEENPYKEAIKWVEEEVYKHGVFNMEREGSYVDIDETKTYRSFPTGNYSGFTVSSQHVSGACNFLQLINSMRRQSDDQD